MTDLWWRAHHPEPLSLRAKSNVAAALTERNLDFELDYIPPTGDCQRTTIVHNDTRVVLGILSDDEQVRNPVNTFDYISTFVASARWNIDQAWTNYGGRVVKIAVVDSSQHGAFICTARYDDAPDTIKYLPIVWYGGRPVAMSAGLSYPDPAPATSRELADTANRLRNETKSFIAGLRMTKKSSTELEKLLRRALLNENGNASARHSDYEAVAHGDVRLQSCWHLLVALTTHYDRAPYPTPTAREHAVTQGRPARVIKEVIRELLGSVGHAAHN